MFTEILIPEVMASMIPEGFPSDKLSQPKYKCQVEKDVFMRCATVHGPSTSTGPTPRASSRPSTPRRLPEGPVLPAAVPDLPHARDQQDRVVRGAGLRLREPRHPRLRQVGGRAVAVAQHAGALGPLRRHRVGRGAALVHRQGGHDRRVATTPGRSGWRPRWRRRTWPASCPSTAAPTCTATWPTTAASWPPASRAGWHITEIRGHYRVGRKGETPTRATGTWPGTSSTTRPSTTSGRTATPTSRTSSARCSASASCTRWASTCAATSAATRR